MNGNPKFTLGIRIVAGAYLIYLAWQILRDGLINGGMTGNMRWVGVGSVILFVVAGGYLAYKASKEMMNITREEKRRQEEEAREQQARITEVHRLEEADEEEPETTESEADTADEAAGSAADEHVEAGDSDGNS